ncbi:SRPBCC family protein [Streptomyces griseocarneus]|uniref:SRPBCC family protein n=1 Tax=Streptomyces griseocarneus TaxID=51201 RepID=UPI00167E3BF6|nr:SRPBCC family protein [Streptomyces griseocarneus]MBZ6474197.1 SRPBCC family protein [Streptomyces griseocarneus]GHG52541.1 hypothetical protein GCM10018779_13890 [Streptomyces griseocarneus]
MRYADGPTAHEEVHIQAAPPEVWKMVTDIELPARFSPELRRAEWLDGATEAVLGAAFAGHNHNPVLGDWRTVSHVVALEPERAFGWAVTDPDGIYGGGPADPAHPMATWTFTLEPASEGTLLRLSVRLGPARSGVSLATDRMPDKEEAIIEHRLGDLRAGMRTTLQGIKDLAEGRA